MTSPQTGIACSSCHIEGREDGHVWNFSDGPRQTPSLAGRMTGQTAPYHWSGQFPDVSSFMDDTIQLRMGGAGLAAEEKAQVAAFIDAQPAPDNAGRHDQLTPAQLRGAQVFQLAQCNTCHTGAALTNNAFADVGTKVTTGPVIDDPVRLAKGFNVPSLLGVARSAPYLHDGSAATLRDRLMINKALDQHGKTSQLTDAQVSDLVAYLEAL